MSIRSKEGIITLLLICAKIIIYIISDVQSGYHWDELLHIEAGNHLALGYADFPPMIGILAWIQNLIQSESLFVNRFFIHLSGIATMLLTTMIVTKLGGKWKAVLIALLCILVSPLFGASHMLFLPVGFSQFFHLLAAYYLISYYQEKEDRYLYLSAISVGLGFLTKYLIGFFILSLGTCVILFDRALLGKKAFWKAVVLFVLIISPNLLWQIIHGFPVLGHFNALMNTDLNTSNLWDEIALIIKYFNPVILIISFVGLLLTAFHKSSNLLKLIGYALILQLLLILIANGKFYYIAPVILTGIGFGAVWMERWVSAQNWILVSIILVILVSGVVLLPHGVPFFTPEKYVKLYKVPETEDGRTPIFFDQFHTRALWPKVLNGLRETIENLPDEEQTNCVIWGKHYGYTGIADLYREEYGFPTAISHMGCYHDWMPALDTSSVYITTGEINLTPAFWYQFFDSVEEIMLIKNKYSLDYQNSGIRIYVCRGLKYNRDEIKGIIDKYYGI
jgi:hypothetical protein